MCEWQRQIPVTLRTIIKPLDCYLTETGADTMKNSKQETKTYFVTIPAHKFLHIRNYESIGCRDFRIFYFYHDPARFWKYIRPIRKIR